jgi:hypothetical protein
MNVSGTAITQHAPVDPIAEGQKIERRRIVELLNAYAMTLDGAEQDRMWTLIHVIKKGAYPDGHRLA